MAQRRMISYKLFENYQFSQLTDREKLVYIGLIVIADDEGRFKADPKYLRAKLFPFEDNESENRVSDISRGVNKLNGLGLVSIWQVNGEQVGEHPNWLKYQNLREERCKPSDILPQNAAKCPHKIREGKISKDKIILQPAVAGVKEIITVFYETVNPTISWENKTLRGAAEYLAKQLGVEKAVALAKYACSVQGQPYAPTITTPYQLKEKLAALKIYSDKQQTKKPKNLS